MAQTAAWTGLLAFVLGLGSPGAWSQTADAPANRQESAEQEEQPQLKDSQDVEGPFALGEQQFTVQFDYKILSASENGSATDETTLSALQILDGNQNPVYEATFPVAVAGGHLGENLSASAGIAASNSGSGIIVRFWELPPPTATAEADTAAAASGSGAAWKESWEMFAMVNGKLGSFGALLPLGEGQGITVGGVVAGVMQKGGIGVQPLASTADVLELAAWTGYFYALVPVRVDWMQGQWGEGQACYQLSSGSLQEKGCTMGVQAVRRVPPADDGTAFVRLFAAADANPYDAEPVPVHSDSQVEFAETRAVTHWMPEGDREQSAFDDIWLHVRVDGKEGWVHTPEDFAALGLPFDSPQPLPQTPAQP